MKLPQLVKQARYGEMTTLSMGTKTWVLLNTGRVVNEIIAKRAALTHERPYFPVAGGLVSRNSRNFLKKTAAWRKCRRLHHQLMMGASSKNYGHLAEVESLGLLRAYLDEPGSWYDHHYRYSVAVMYKIITNGPLQKSRAELRDLQNVTSTFLTSINSCFVEFFPQLTWLPRPLQRWRPHWDEMGQYHYRTYKDWWAGMKKLASGDEPSFMRDTILETYPATENEAMYDTILAITAGADNPRMTMNAFVMACLAYPGVVQKAREEIDRICGADAERLPSLDDLPNLPYMCAVVKEVLRWRPTVPLIPQRVLVEDMEFEGYRFPAGTEFLTNSIPVCSDSHDRPAEFLPERWLGNSTERGSGVEQDLWQFAFSGGRRSCVGYKLAQKELFIVFSRLIYCFDITAAGDFDDEVLNAFKVGEPFPVKVAVRSSGHERLIRAEAVKVDTACTWG